MGARTMTETHRAELPGWLKVVIFALTLFVVMWLTMSVFFKPLAR